MPLKALMPSEEIASFRNALGQKVSIRELETTLDNLNLSDLDDTAAAVKRCNNRCRGNKIAIQVVDPKAPPTQPPLTFSLRISD